MALFKITVNEYSFYLEPSRINLDDCKVIEIEIDPKTDSFFYQFKSGDFSYSWEQKKPSGKISVEEVGINLGVLNLVKEIEY